MLTSKVNLPRKFAFILTINCLSELSKRFCFHWNPSVCSTSCSIPCLLCVSNTHHEYFTYLLPFLQSIIMCTGNAMASTLITSNLFGAKRTHGRSHGIAPSASLSHTRLSQQNVKIYEDKLAAHPDSDDPAPWFAKLLFLFTHVVKCMRNVLRNHVVTVNGDEGTGFSMKMLHTHWQTSSELPKLVEIRGYVPL